LEIGQGEQGGGEGMNSRIPGAIGTVLAILALGEPVGAEDAVARDSERRVCVYDFTNYTDQADEGASAAGTYSPLIADTLAMELERAGYLVVGESSVREARRSMAPDPEGNVAKASRQDPQIGPGVADFALAASLGADVLVTGSYRLEGGRLYAVAMAWDLFSSRLAVSLIEQGEAGTAVFETIDEIARLVAEKARSSLRPLTPAELVIRSERVKVETRVIEKQVELGKVIDITLRSPDEGAEVWIGDDPAGRIAKGSLIVRAKAGAALAVSLRGKGLRDSTQDFLVEEGKQSYELQPCYRVTEFELGMVYSTVMPLGLSASYRLHNIPDVLWSEFQFGAGTGTVYTMVPYQGPSTGTGPTPPPTDVTTPGALLLRQSLSVGWYPFQEPASLIRFGIVGSIGNIVSLAPGVFGDELSFGLGFMVAYNAPRWTGDISARIQWEGRPTLVSSIEGNSRWGVVEMGLRWKF
jgi:hypothetical protein